MIYVFDTSALVAWWHEIYPIQSFPDIRKLIEQGIEHGNIKSAMEVKRELRLQDDDLFEWTKKTDGLFIEDQEDQQFRISEIGNEYPRLVKQHRLYNADPVIITLAEANSWTVVTQENPNKQNNIVGCCRNIGIDCISLTQYINHNQTQLHDIRKILFNTNIEL